MFIKRTDLALEARELWQESAERTTRLMGVKATKSKLEGYPVHQILCTVGFGQLCRRCEVPQ